MGKYKLHFLHLTLPEASEVPEAACSSRSSSSSLSPRNCNLAQVKLKGFCSMPHWEPLSRLEIELIELGGFHC